MSVPFETIWYVWTYKRRRLCLQTITDKNLDISVFKHKLLYFTCRTEINLSGHIDKCSVLTNIDHNRQLYKDES